MNSPDYPVYRKYTNNKSYFKVLAAHQFEEIQVMGTTFSTHLFTAKILPDRNLISDMLALAGGSWEAITAEQYDDFMKFCHAHYTYTGHFA